MSARQELNSYLARLEQRLRVGTLSQGAAILTSSALVATVVLVLGANALAFSEGSVTAARLLLVCAIGSAAVFGVALPLWRLSRAGAVRKAEVVFPQFQQRLVTFAEREEAGDDPFIDLLAADALEVAAGAEPAVVAPNWRVLMMVGTGAVSVAVLVWMITAMPGFLGYGAHLLWTGSHAGAAPLYDIKVSPGDITVRRHADQLITAQPSGMLAPTVRLYARYQSASKWEPVTMQPRSGSSGYQFVFTGLPENVEYYVQAGARQSAHFNIKVVDLPSVKQIKVTYHYPAWTGLKDTVEERGGDIRAIEGTRAELEVATDRPLASGLLVLDNGQQVRLTGGGEGNRYTGEIQVDADGLYHVAALDAGQPVRLSEDFFIEARKAGAPDVVLSRPGGDYRASPIEEVTFAVRARDEFGLKDLQLHYSVNGAPEKTVPLLKQSGEKEANGTSMLALEDFKLVPGDLISVYATAKDARSESHTDMMFVQVDPFEREFSQSQQSGGGGGGGGGGGQGNDPSEISRREKEMIAATFKQQGDKKATEKQAAETAKFLSDAQATLRDQSESLAGRLDARELTRENPEFSAFQQEMAAAAEAMGPAASTLKAGKWQSAIPEEQKALQHLLRAEATFRQIEVAFGARGGGGGGGGAGRDLASLFDLELDTQKNQYETQQSASSADERAQSINDALQKLDELARRQEELAAKQRNDSAQSFDQRWQQEMLQREAEQLQKQVEQLARQQNGQQQSGQQQNGQQQNGQQQGGQQQNGQQQGGQQSGQQGSGQAQAGQSGQGGQSGQSGQSAQTGQSGQSGQAGQPGEQGRAQQSQADARARASEQAAQQALDRLRQAQDEMRRAASQGQNAADARLAAERLREASSLLGGAQAQDATGRLGSIAREADRLASEEKSQADRVKQLKDRSQTGGAQRGDSAKDIQQLAADRQRLADQLAGLEQNMRNAAKELSSTQRAVADKLRQALDGADSSDLETRLQRTADWLRTGIDPNANGTETQIAAGLQRLRDETAQAQQALTPGGQSRPGAEGVDAALDNLDRLRRQVEAMRGQNGAAGQGADLARNRTDYQTGALSRDGQGGQPGQQGQPGQAGQQGQPGQQGQAGQPGQPGQQGQAGQQGGRGQQGQGGGQGPQGGQNAQGQNGGRGSQGGQGGRIGDIAPGGGRVDGQAVDQFTFDTGNNGRAQGKAASPQATPAIDNQQSIQQGVNELNQLRQQASADPEVQRQIQQLIGEMEHLDLKRFPGNPAMVEELHQRLLSGLDTLELQLRRDLDGKKTGQIRGADPIAVPLGYKDAVADYFRRLSTTTTSGAGGEK